MTDKNYLSDFSPRDKPWDIHRSFSDKVESLYEQIGYHGYSERIAQCSQILEYALAATNDGELVTSLQNARFCRCRQCPVCQWRRSLMWKARFFQALPKIRGDYPTARYLFLTLTVKNCLIEDLRETVTHMNKSWQRLSQKKCFPAIGYLKSLEVTRGSDGSAHPHFHILLMVPSGYFKSTGGYLNHDKWVELWKKSLRVQYSPIVHITAVKAKSDNSLEDAIKETLKYCVKEEDLVIDAEWLRCLTEQLHKTRSVSLSGTFRHYLSVDDPDDLIHTDDVEAKVLESDRFYFGWKKDIKRYSQVRTSNSSMNDNSQ